MSCRGLFLTFEGPEGSGKTTQSAMLARRLEDAGHRVLAVREPGGTAVGEALRDVLLNHPGQPLDVRAETLIFAAARAQLVTEVLKPALDQGCIVLCDRFADSTLAYQGFGHCQDLSLLRPMIEYATGGLEPSLRIFLDIPPADGLARCRTEGRKDAQFRLADAGTREWNRMDALDLAFHQRVHEGYLELAGQNPDRWLTVDAKGGPATVHTRIWDGISVLLPDAAEAVA